MKSLCLAYGHEKDWKALTKAQQDELLAQDEVIRRRGDLVAPVRPAATVRAPGGNVTLDGGPFARAGVPLAGFALIEAGSVEEVVELVSGTPCPRAGGAVEIWPVLDGS